MRTYITTLATVALMALSVPTVHADLVAVYDASQTPNDPVSQDWGAVSSGGTGSFVNDGGTPAWKISTPIGALNYYYQLLTPTGVNDASGWTATYRVRVVDHTDPYPDVALAVANGSYRWAIDVRSNGIAYQVNGDGTALIQSMDTTSAYHTYQMIYSPSTQTVGVYADGSLLTTLGTSVAYSTPDREIHFGDGTSFDSSPAGANYNYVSLETGQHPYAQGVPEPSTFAIAGLCATLALAYAWRRRQRVMIMP